jgi:hypothetical protein
VPIHEGPFQRIVAINFPAATRTSGKVIIDAWKDSDHEHVKFEARLLSPTAAAARWQPATNGNWDVQGLYIVGQGQPEFGYIGPFARAKNRVDPPTVGYETYDGAAGICPFALPPPEGLDYYLFYCGPGYVSPWSQGQFSEFKFGTLIVNTEKIREQFTPTDGLPQLIRVQVGAGAVGPNDGIGIMRVRVRRFAAPATGQSGDFSVNELGEVTCDADLIQTNEYSAASSLLYNLEFYIGG